MKQLVFIIATIFALITACTGLTEEHLPSEEFEAVEDVEEIKASYRSNYPGENGVEKVITSHLDFKTEWEKIFSTNSQPPEIDFENRTVVLIMLDKKPSGGYRIDEISVSYNQSEMIVGYSEFQPGPYCGVTRALTRPYMIFSVPKMAGEVKISKENIISTDCSA